MNKLKWKWRGLAGHFIGASDCIFRLCTDIGDVRISTVGAYYPGGYSSQMQEIGLGRHYETMVFKLENGNVEKFLEIDTKGLRCSDFNNPEKFDDMASEMHMRMCIKWEDVQKQGKQNE